LEINWLYNLITLAILLVLSAFFSGSEVALFSIEKKRLKDIKKDNGLVGEYIYALLDNPRRLLVTILLGNTAVNVGASIIAVNFALDIAQFHGLDIDFILLLEIIILTILLLLFGEITPKILATKNPFLFSKVVAIPLYWTSVLIYPASKILSDLIKGFVSNFSYDKTKTALKDSEINELAEIGVEKGTIEENEHEIIQGLVAFKRIRVSEVMTPRVDIIAVNEDTSFDSMIELINESGHSRIPMYSESIDNIIGIIYAKDLIPFIKSSGNKEDFSLKKLARKAYFVPGTKNINILMQEFQEKNLHIGIVVDEYGGTLGLISLEDILEEIVGEIRDEYDDEENDIIKLGNNTFSVIGKISIEELNELLGTDIESENDDYDTLGGYIFNIAGIIPKEEFTFNDKGYSFTVKEVSNRRINRVLIQRDQSKEFQEEKGE